MWGKRSIVLGLFVPAIAAAQPARTTMGSPTNPVTRPSSAIEVTLNSAYASMPADLQYFGAISATANHYAKPSDRPSMTRAFFGRAYDFGGNRGLEGATDNFIEGARFHGEGTQGVAYSATYGLISYANAWPGLPYRYIIGHESQVDNLFRDAPLAHDFQPSNFVASFLCTSGEQPTVQRTYKPDSCLSGNPFNPSPPQTGVLFPARSIADTAFYNAASIRVGLDLADGIYKQAPIMIPSGTGIDVRVGPQEIVHALRLSGTPTENTTGLYIVTNRNSSIEVVQVRVGAPDSCGKGQRCLSIPN